MIAALLMSVCCCLAAAPVESAEVILVVGAGGTSEYAQQFDTWADRWQAAAERSGASLARVDADDSQQRQVLQKTLEAAASGGEEPLWIVLIGHGTFDGQRAKFNLRGPDVSAEDLNGWLTRFTRPLVVINCASASGPFMHHLAGPGRVVVTATKSGHEQNFSRFGDHLSAALTDKSADLDKDQQVSLLEAFLTASRGVEEFYRQKARLATEHALLDDTGDGLGIPADWFRGVRATRKPKEDAQRDGLQARQIHLIASDAEQSLSPQRRAQRDKLEQAVEQLREQKDDLGEEDYYQQLEILLVDLALLYEQLDKSGEE